MAGICLRGKPGWGELGAVVHDRAEHVRGTWWSAKPDGTPDKAHGGPACVPEGAPSSTSTWSGTPASGRRQLQLQRVPRAVPERQGRDVVRRDRRRRPARGLQQPGERARTATRPPRSSGRRRRDGCGPGRSPSRRPRTKSDLSLAVHRVGDRAAVRQEAAARGSRAGGRRSRRARAARPTRSRSTGRPPARSPSRHSPRSSPRRSTTRARPSAPATRASNTSASRSSRMSATSAPSSSRR